MLFGPVICTELLLICTLQITANQALPIFGKPRKTRANQRKSLQINGPKKTLKKQL
jgi:hypothetical protein